MAKQLKALLFLSTDSQKSKLQPVVQDLLLQGVSFKQNEFTTNVIRMLTADSVNVLQRVKDAEFVDSDESKPKIPWRSVR